MRIQSRFLRLLGLTAFLTTTACSGGGDDTTDDVTPPNTVKIDSFTASMNSVASGATVVLSYKVTNGTSLSISANPGGSLLSESTTFEGTVTTAAITESTVFTLTAQGTGGPKMATVTVMIDANAVAVLSFTATPNPSPVNGDVNLAWTTSGATQVRVLEGTTELLNTTTDVASGTFKVTVDRMSHTYVLEASNATGMDTDMVTVTVITPGKINAFTATPNVFSGPSGSIQIHWEAEGETFGLTANGAAVGAFPNTGTGTITVTVTETTLFELTATGAGTTDTRRVAVAAAVTEGEPNNDIATATPITGGATGSISPADDIDFYSFTVGAGGNVFAETSDGMGGCALDTVIRLYDSTGTELGSADQNGVGDCSQMDPRFETFAADLPAGTYYISVESYLMADEGDYSLVVLVGQPGCGNEIIEPSRSESCDDGNTTAGDGCAADCTLEVAGTITGTGGTIQIPINGDQNAIPTLVRVVLSMDGQSITATTSDGAGSCAIPTVIGLFREDTLETLVVSRGNGGCAYLDPLANPAHLAASNLPAGNYLLGVIAENEGEMGQTTVDVTIGNPACGNRLIETLANEQCDDGNTTGGDGCSETCQVQPLGTVTGLGQTMSFQGAIDPASQSDYYQVVMDGPGYIRAETGSPTVGTCAMGVDTVVGLYDSTFMLLGENDDIEFGNTCSLIDPRVRAFAAVPAGTYYVAVHSYAMRTVISDYQLEIRTIAQGCGNENPRGRRAVR